MRSSHDNVYGTPTSHHTVDGIRFVLHHFEATALDELFFVHPELPRLNCSLGAFGHSVTCYASTNGAASHTPHP